MATLGSFHFQVRFRTGFSISAKTPAEMLTGMVQSLQVGLGSSAIFGLPIHGDWVLPIKSLILNLHGCPAIF